MLTTLFASTGTIMLTAGDESGRTQQGNNNAYCQDNEIGWFDWAARDIALEDFVAGLAARRAALCPSLAELPADVTWHRIDGGAMTDADWNAPGAPGFTLTVQGDAGAYRFTADRSSGTAAFDAADGQPLRRVP